MCTLSFSRTRTKIGKFSSGTYIRAERSEFIDFTFGTVTPALESHYRAVRLETRSLDQNKLENASTVEFFPARLDDKGIKGVKSAEGRGRVPYEVVISG